MAAEVLELDHIFGVKGDVNGSIHFIDENIVAYPCGHLIILYNLETKKQRFINGSEGSKGITCMAMAPNKRVLAVAERADKGCITIYDVVSLKKRKVLTSSDMQSSEIVHMNFSADSKLLLTQGGAPDWTLTCWAWEKAKALVTSKVSNVQGSRVNQADISPYDNSIICVSGDLILKFFRIQDGQFKPLILNMKRDLQNFTCHSWISEDRVVVGTDVGELLLFESCEFRGTLSYTGVEEILPVRSCVAYSKGFITGGSDGVIRIFERSDESRDYYKHTKTFSVENSDLGKVTTIAISPSEDNLIISLSTNQLHILGLSNTDILKSDEMKFEFLASSFHAPGTCSTAKVSGMDVCLQKPLLVTCGVDKSVRIWNYVDKTSELVKVFEEEAYSASFHPSGLHILVGFADKLRLMNLLMDDIRSFQEIPMKACRECKFSNGGQYFAAVNGNAIQIFATYTIECLYTFRAHSGKVKSVHWSQDDSQLVSAGVDGLVYRWNIKEGRKDAEYMSKGSSFSQAVSLDSACEQVIVADAEAAVLRLVDCPTGKVLVESMVSHALNQTLLNHNRNLLFSGTCDAELPSAIVMHNLPLSEESAEAEIHLVHSAPVTRMCITHDDSLLFTASEDGSIACFNVNFSQPTKPDDVIFTEEILVTKSDIEATTSLVTDLKLKVDELTLHNKYQLRLKDMNYDEKIKEVTASFTEELKEDDTKYKLLLSEKDDMEQKYKDQIVHVAEQHKVNLAEIENTYQAKINAEIDRFQALLESRNQLNINCEDQNALLVESHEQYINQLTDEFEKRLQNEQEERLGIVQQKGELIKDFEETKNEIELDADSEIEELKHRYDAKLSAEREATLRLKGENGIMKKKFTSLTNDIEEQKEKMKSLLDRESELYMKIKGLEKDISGHKKEIKEREETIQDKEKRIYDLKKKNQELEKFKFVLDYKIKELKRQIEPRENEISDMRHQIKEMDLELGQYHKCNAALDLMIGELKLKIEGMQTEIDKQNSSLKDSAVQIARRQSDLHDCIESIADHHDLKKKVVKLFKVYVQQDNTVNTSSSKGGDASLQREYNRQREYLEKSVASLKVKLSKDIKANKNDQVRLMRESVELTNALNVLRREMTNLKLIQKKHAWMLSSPKPPINNKINNVNKTASANFSKEGQREINLQQQQLASLQEQIARLEEALCY